MRNSQGGKAVEETYLPYDSEGLGVVELPGIVFTSSASSKRVFESNPGELGVESLDCMV